MNDTQPCSTTCTSSQFCPPDGAVATTEQLAAMSKALGHPMRLRLMRVLLERGSCVCGELVLELPLAQSTVSQHLKVLREAALVQGEVDGPRVCYCVDEQALAWYQQQIAMLQPRSAVLTASHGSSAAVGCAI